MTLYDVAVSMTQHAVIRVDARSVDLAIEKAFAVVHGEAKAIDDWEWDDGDLDEYGWHKVSEAGS